MSDARRVTAAELAAIVAPTLPDGLLALDVDGVLAPLVDHADDARLLPGVHETLAALTTATEVAIVSGRSLESLERLFAFPADVHVVGSHGLELRGRPTAPLDDDERYTFEQLEIIAERGVTAAGPGAWLERKPASVVLHTREADAELAAPAVDAATNLASMIDGATVKPGSNVVELLARSTTKGAALVELAERLDRTTTTYLGDDVTDEEAFRALGGDDVTVRVGPGATAARFRIDSPTDVAELLAALAATV